MARRFEGVCGNSFPRILKITKGESPEAHRAVGGPQTAGSTVPSERFLAREMLCIAHVRAPLADVLAVEDMLHDLAEWRPTAWADWPRGADEGTRLILDFERVEEPGAEASVAMNCFRRIAPLVPGAQGVVYDTALRGVHHQELLRDLGLLPINRRDGR